MNYKYTICEEHKITIKIPKEDFSKTRSLKISAGWTTGRAVDRHVSDVRCCRRPHWYHRDGLWQTGRHVRGVADLTGGTKNSVL